MLTHSPVCANKYKVLITSVDVNVIVCLCNQQVAAYVDFCRANYEYHGAQPQTHFTPKYLNAVRPQEGIVAVLMYSHLSLTPVA